MAVEVPMYDDDNLSDDVRDDEVLPALAGEDEEVPVDLFEFSDSRPKWKPEPWMKTKNFVLVTDARLTECIDACINSPDGRVALDLECTGLDNRVFDKSTVDKIVGVCLSGDGITGWYIPLRHQNFAGNVSYTLFDREFRRLMAAIMENKLVAVFHNGKFDQEFLEYPGEGLEPYGNWEGHATWEDTLILAYLRWSRARVKGLKALSEAPPTATENDPTGGPGLGMKMIELEELFHHLKGAKYAGPLDYSLLDPSNPMCLAYGCSDGICTYLLCGILKPAVIGPKAKPDQKTIYAIEKSAVAGTRWMERNRIHISREKVLELIQLGQQEWYESVMAVYESANEILGRDVMPGYFKVLRDKFVANDQNNLLSAQLDTAKAISSHYYPDPMGTVPGRDSEGKDTQFPIIYDVTAPQQLGKMFDEMQVPGLKRTEKSGQVQTSKDELERVIEGTADRFPFMAKIRKFRETNKALATYLYPVLNGMDPKDNSIRISFNGHRVDTGRYCTPSKDKDGLDAKSQKQMVGWPSLNFQAVPATYDPRRPACMNRIRECFVSEPGYFIVGIDFSGEELRLITNLYREPKWENEFFRCSACSRTFPKGEPGKTPTPPPARCPNCGSDKIGDLHTLTALEIFGADAITRPEWKELRKDAKGVNFGLSYGGGGQAVCRATGCDKNEGWRIKNQFDATYPQLVSGWSRQHEYGRKHNYVLTGFGRKYPVPDINSADGGFRSKAERNSVNGPIQGTGADMIKIAMALVYKECKKRGWLGKVKMIATMHDELVFEVWGPLLAEAIPVLVQTMTSNGFIMQKGWPVPFTSDVELGLDYTVKWALNDMFYKEVRFVGNKKYKKAEEAAKDGHDWDNLPSYPALLAPFLGPQALVTPPDGGAASPPPPTPTSDGEAPASPPPPTSAPLSAEDPTVMSRQMEIPQPTIAPRLPKGSEFSFRVKSLTPGIVSALAEIIDHCRGMGTHRLRLVDPTGTMLSGWDRDGEVLVDSTTFMNLASYKKLI